MDLNKDSEYFLELQTKTGWGQMLASFARWCAPAPGDLALDVGCGPGLLPALFAKNGISAYGCDADRSMLDDPIHPHLLTADGFHLPVASSTFNLVSASNLLFLHTQPQALLNEMARVARRGGSVCLLNPSEQMSVAAATALADENNLDGLARETLLNYAMRAEANYRWRPDELLEMYELAGLQFIDTVLRMGPGLVRYAKGAKQN